MASLQDMAEFVDETKERSRRAPVLLYAGSCAKCRFISSFVGTFSLQSIEQIPLDVAEWDALYRDYFPEARGYPILFYRGRPWFGGRVFLATPLVAVISALRALDAALKR